MGFMDGVGDPCSTVYGYVPIALVAEFVNSHGGMVGGELPPFAANVTLKRDGQSVTFGPDGVWAAHGATLDTVLAALAAPPERMFPIQGGPAIPWSAIAPCEAQAERNHSQTLERLAQRGGLDPTEAIDVLLSQPYSTTHRSGISNADAITKLLTIVAEGRALAPEDAPAIQVDMPPILKGRPVARRRGTPE